MSEEKKVIYYSLVSGDVYEIPADEVENLDDFQIPLLRKPKSNCKTCYGRGYIGFDAQKKYYPMCRCIMSKIDKERLDGDIKLKY
jgi:hypothetical protein